MTRLYSDRKFSTWTVGRIAEVLSEEWYDLNPTLSQNTRVYGKKTALISFNGSVIVSLDVGSQPYAKPGRLDIGVGLSLSPNSWKLETHALNTFDFGMYIGLFSQLANSNFFSITKNQPWKDSSFSAVVDAGRMLIAYLQDFDSCFDFLTKDRNVIVGTILDTGSLGTTYHLNCVKAYHLAKAYNHPEKLDEAIKAIRKSAGANDFTRQRLERICQTKDARGLSWLYTPEIIESLGN